MMKFEGGPKFKEWNSYETEYDSSEIMSEVYNDCLNVLTKLKPRIESGEFGMVLGIDSSGRVPALMLSETINHYHPISKRFVVSNRHYFHDPNHDARDDFKRQFASKNFRDAIGGKSVLIVDDTFYSGSTLGALTETLEELGIDFQIVTLRFLSGSLTVSSPRSGQLISASSSTLFDEFPQVSDKEQMSGVSKKLDAYSEPLPPNLTEQELLKKKRQRISSRRLDADTQDKEVLKYTRKTIKEASRMLATELGWIKDGNTDD